MELFRTVLAGGFHFAMAETQNKEEEHRWLPSFGWLHLLQDVGGSAPGLPLDQELLTILDNFCCLAVQEWCRGKELVRALAWRVESS